MYQSKSLSCNWNNLIIVLTCFMGGPLITINSYFYRIFFFNNSQRHRDSPHIISLKRKEKKNIKKFDMRRRQLLIHNFQRKPTKLKYLKMNTPFCCLCFLCCLAGGTLKTKELLFLSIARHVYIVYESPLYNLW